MFKSIFFEGFGRPCGGVRTIIDLLHKKLSENGVEIHYKSEVTKILSKENKIVGVEINREKEVFAKQVLSSIGLPETFSISSELQDNQSPEVGKLSFCETILITKEKPAELGSDATIIFYNNRPEYLYQRATDFFDQESAVVCFPNNFDYRNYSDDYEEGVLRITNIANFEKWNHLRNFDKKAYQDKKNDIESNALKILSQCGLKNPESILFKDIFTPATIKRYTHHFDGTVYGSTQKSRNGTTPIDGLFVIGTDQGFLGIVGSMLSGISMANLHVLQGEA